MNSLFSRFTYAGNPTADALHIGSHSVPIQFVRNPKARRYIIRVQLDGSVRATVPSRGSLTEARAFVERNTAWIANQLQKHDEQPPPATVWQPGTEILYRGERVPLVVRPNNAGSLVQLGDQVLAVSFVHDLRPAIERHLRKLATTELTTRTVELSTLHGLTIKRVSVRNQRSRWGSCSRRGTIALNWRLIQMPDAVRDYIILHELAHTREHNHSRRFWSLVEQLCPGFQEARVWIRKHRALLR